jgi:hypothetical protein
MLKKKRFTAFLFCKNFLLSQNNFFLPMHEMMNKMLLKQIFQIY